MKIYTFHISGLHCNACKILVEDILSEQIGINNVHVDMKKSEVSLETELHENKEQLADILSRKLEHNGYVLSVEKIKHSHHDGVILQALPLGIIFLILFFVLQKSGILNFGIGGQVTPVTSFMIGLVASVSSCLAIVGGLVLSLSAKVSQDKVSDRKNIILFHIARIVGFGIFGGLLGLLGQTITINPLVTGILGLFVALVMIFLGADLAGFFSYVKLTLPGGIFQMLRKIEHKTLTPVIIGLGTFFLPCGFTQSMQIAALSSSSFLHGGLIMFAFALGTFPVLALLSFGTEGFSQSKYAPLFFRTAGIVVLGLGIISLLAGLAAIGIITPVINF